MFRRFFSNSTIQNLGISITNRAWDKMKHIMKETKCHSFWFFADSGGCNGFNYELQPLDKSSFEKMVPNSSKLPKIILEKEDIKCLVDPSSELLLQGTTIDFTEKDPWKGVLNDKFIFIPNKEFARACGCGVSFSPHDMDV